MLKSLSRSLSFRLLIIFLALAASFVYFSISAVRWVYDTDDLRDLVSGHLSLHIDYVLDDIGEPPRIARAIEITRRVPVDIRISGPQIDWASDPNFPSESELQFNARGALSSDAVSFLNALPNADFATWNEHTFLRLRRGDHAIIVASPKIAETVTNRQAMPIIVGVGLSLVLLAYLAVRWLFRPVSAIQRGAARIGQGRFNERITRVRADQLGDLAEDINKMAAEVQGMLDAKRQLLLGISHELRTPLSRLRLAIEILDDVDDALVDADGMRGDINEMDTVITSLLEAEHLNSRHAALHLAPSDPRKMIDGLINDFFTRARHRIQTEFRGRERSINVDETRVSLMIKNLVSNALRYSTEGDGPVKIIVELREADMVLRVEDFGPGIPETQRDRIGEPFFRGDPSRTRATGGSGLGLYLATLVAQAHGGALTLDENYHQGAAFEVCIPG
ncbi:MAG: HAMP domain-containing protein [Woeseia sp.]|nr:HAMP domain-containing protein [Woeseia sp.]NNL55926.1 HAMP domain-containing protein [Woeseia sp.]